MNFVEYLMENYIWLFAILIVIIITIIGFIADRRSSKRKKKKENIEEPINNESIIEKVDVDPTPAPKENNADDVVPEFVMGPEIPSQVNIEQNERIDEIKVEEPVEVIEEPLPENPTYEVLNNPAETNNNIIPGFPEVPQTVPETTMVEQPVNIPVIPVTMSQAEQPTVTPVPPEPIIPVIPLVEQSVEPVIKDSAAPVLNSWTTPIKQVSNVENTIPTIEPIPVVNPTVNPEPEVNQPFDVNPAPVVENPIIGPAIIGPESVQSEPAGPAPQPETVQTADIQENDMWKL